MGKRRVRLKWDSADPANVARGNHKEEAWTHFCGVEGPKMRGFLRTKGILFLQVLKRVKVTESLGNTSSKRLLSEKRLQRGKTTACCSFFSQLTATFFLSLFLKFLRQFIHTYISTISKFLTGGRSLFSPTNKIKNERQFMKMSQLLWVSNETTQL